MRRDGEKFVWIKLSGIAVFVAFLLKGLVWIFFIAMAILSMFLG